MPAWWLAFWTRAPGGFGSLAEVMALFTMPEIALAGWIHYLAFDLFLGAGEVQDGAAREDRVSPGTAVPGPDVPVRAGRVPAVQRAAGGAGAGLPPGGGAVWSVATYADAPRAGLRIGPVVAEPLFAAAGAVFLMMLLPTGVAMLRRRADPPRARHLAEADELPGGAGDLLLHDGGLCPLAADGDAGGGAGTGSTW